MEINAIAIAMMNVGELLSREEVIDATANYKLIYKTDDNVFGLISDGIHFDVLAYVDMREKLFEHIYSSEDYDYPVSRVIYTLQKYGDKIAAAHLPKGDMMGAYINEQVVKRENLEDLLKITKAQSHTITYAVVSNKGYKIYSTPCHPKAKWLVHKDTSKELFTDERGLREVTIVSNFMYRADMIVGNTIYSPGGIVTDNKTLGYYIDATKKFTDALIPPYPARSHLDSKYKSRALFQWVHTVCDEEGNELEREYV